ncbi:MAG: zf-HC2 domain-containing protein [Acidobacteria bacterium]|nr:zf-HC2 domain-containing protein [Acidobacteriota bacterium]
MEDTRARTIKCERAAALMPLYAAGDLAEARAGEVASHVATCEPCRALAEEFADSRRLLAEALATPEFGAEFYAGIRGDVLARVRADREPTSPSGFVASLFFGRRLVYAASLAAVAFACLVAFQHFRHGGRETQPEIADAAQGAQQAGGDGTPTTPQKQTTTQPKRRQESAGGAEIAPSGAAVTRRRTADVRVAAFNRNGATNLHGTTERRDAPVVAPRDGGALIAQALSPPKNGAASVVAGGGSQSSGVSASPSARGASAEGALSRIEIQTADPTIRIIWLTPLKQEEPKPDRDNHENGDRK